MAYLGNAPVVGDSTNSFRLLDDIASFTLTFDATDTAVVSIANDTLSFTNHRFVNGQKVTYTDGGGTAIGGLSDGTSYFIIKVDQNTIKLATNASNAASSTAINLTSGAAGGSHTLNVKFDGVNTKFKATFNNGKKAKISRAAQLSLSINGVVQQPQDSSSPSVGYGVEADSTIVFSTAPVATDVVFGSFIGEVAASFDIEDNTVDNFTGDGSTTIFNLSKEVPSSQDVLVTIDGVTQYPSDGSTTRSYSVVNQALTFVSAPADGTAIQARHIGFAGAVTSAVTGFYGRTGNAALISTDDISVQNISGVGATFTGNVNIEGVLTYEDVTNVDSIGIITARAGVLVGSGITLSKDGDGFFTGVCTATSFVGDGSALTGITQTTINNNADNRLITGSGTANTLNGESNLTFDGSAFTVNGDAVFAGDNYNVSWDKSNNYLQWADNAKAVFGASADLQLYHDGGASRIIESGTGGLIIQTSNFNLDNGAGTENLITATENGSVDLYYDNSKKFETHTNGARVDGVLGVGLDPQSTNSSTYVVQGVATNQCLFAAFRSQDGTNTSTNGMLMGLDNNYHYLIGRENRPLRFGANNVVSTEIDTSGHLRPTADNTYDLGASSRRWRNLYTTDLQLSNEGKSNDVDGTWGDYTIQEGESDLFLINNRNGKKYKFNLTEVS